MAQFEGSRSLLVSTVEPVDPVKQRKAGLYIASKVKDKEVLDELLQMLGIKETPESFVSHRIVDRKPMGQCGHYLDGYKQIKGGARRFCKTCRPEWIKEA